MKKMLTAIALSTMLFYLPACKGKVKDADVKTAVEAALASTPGYSGLMVDVKDGAVTITGEVTEASAKTALQSTVSAVKGVKSVQDNTTVMAPPPPPAPAPDIAADDPLTKGVTDALKDHPGIKATVSDGVITVTGEIKAADWRKVKMALDGLKPKKVDASGLKVK
ncbi:MAG TPA: BON domain-containing protein [Chitinophagaceae bacterium]|nr:BON domain-containing protein [Chitinophagaceae bacterium]